LAQRWHPDRHAADSQNEAEANAEMRRINDAYQRIVESQSTVLAGGEKPLPTARRLSPEEIDRLATAIGTQGPVDLMLDSLSWVGNAYEALLFVVGGVVIAVQLARALWQRDLSIVRQHPEMILIVALVLLLIAREGRARDRVVSSEARDGQ
jgi:hypothetical protein